MEVRKGGTWRYIQHDLEGNEFAFNGIYHEVNPPERIIYTWEYEGRPGHVLTETQVFEDLKGRTKITSTPVFQTVEDRDGMYRSGMQEGARLTTERMAKPLKKMRSK